MRATTVRARAQYSGERCPAQRNDFPERKAHSLWRPVEIDPMTTDVLDRACDDLWREIRALLTEHRTLDAAPYGEAQRRELMARVSSLRRLSARFREVQRQEGRGGVTRVA